MARAIELDADSGLLSAQQVRAIAAEVGVSADAIERAIAERAAAAGLPRPGVDAERDSSSALYIAVLAALGVLTGAAMGGHTLSDAVGEQTVAFGGLGLLTVASLVEIVRHRDGR